MFRYAKTFLIICAMIGMMSCDTEPQQPDELDVPLSPLKPLVFELECREYVLLLGQSCQSAEGSSVHVRLQQISQDLSSCLLEIENKSRGTKLSGWVRVNDFVDFAKQDVGSNGLQVARLQADRVTLCFYSCRTHEGQFDIPEE